MVISFEHNFIFIRPLKVASTSIEKSLRAILPKNNLLSRFTPDMENVFFRARTQYYTEVLKKTPPTNTIITKRDTAEWGRYFGSHIDIRKAQSFVGEPAWQNMFKWSVVRNPFDRVISHYIQRAHASPQENLTKDVNGFRQWLLKASPEFVQTEMYYFAMDAAHKHPLKNLDGTYKKALDFYVRYEHLEEDFATLSRQLNLPQNIWETLKNTHRKADRRPSELTIEACFAGFPKGIARIEKLTEPVLTTFGYTSPKA